MYNFQQVKNIVFIQIQKEHVLQINFIYLWGNQKDGKGYQNTLSQNITLWHVDYLELKVDKNQQIQKKL